MEAVSRATGAIVTGRKARVAVTILGEEYTVKGEAHPDYIRKIAGYVDVKMQQIAEANPRLARNRVAILACLTLADELEKLKTQYDGLLDIVERAK